MGSENTTIKINKKTKERLDNLKEHEKESYEEVIEKILHVLNITRKNPLLANRVLRGIDKSIKRRQLYFKQTKQAEQSEKII